MEIRWTTNASNDLVSILHSTEKKMTRDEACDLFSLVDSAIGVIDYNPKSGKKEPLLADLFEYDIRWFPINKYCKLFYSETPEAILILALQNSYTPIDTKRRVKNK